jgi:hypothetical protein
MHIGRERRFQHASVRGESSGPDTTCMISTAADLAAALVADLPPEAQDIVVVHFFDGEIDFQNSTTVQIETPGPRSDDGSGAGLDVAGTAESGRPGRWRPDLIRHTSETGH